MFLKMCFCVSKCANLVSLFDLVTLTIEYKGLSAHCVVKAVVNALGLLLDIDVSNELL